LVQFTEFSALILPVGLSHGIPQVISRARQDLRALRERLVQRDLLVQPDRPGLLVQLVPQLRWVDGHRYHLTVGFLSEIVCSPLLPNKSLDASGGSVFRK
jgi:hypothetical protein